MTLLMVMNLGFAWGQGGTPQPSDDRRGRTRRTRLLGTLFGGR